MGWVTPEPLTVVWVHLLHAWRRCITSAGLSPCALAALYPSIPLFIVVNIYRFSFRLLMRFSIGGIGPTGSTPHRDPKRSARSRALAYTINNSFLILDFVKLICVGCVDRGGVVRKTARCGCGYTGLCVYVWFLFEFGDSQCHNSWKLVFLCY